VNQEAISRHWVQLDFDGEDRLIWGVHNQSSRIWNARSIFQHTIDHQMMPTEHRRDLQDDLKKIGLE